MPSKKRPSSKRKLVLKEPDPDQKDLQNLDEFIREAGEVKGLTLTSGWQIIERDLNDYRWNIAKKLAYLDPKRPEFNESRILFLAAEKLLDLVSDYEENRTKAIELLNKLQNPELAITMDIDNE